MSDHLPFPSITIPDTKIYIYDIDMDNFMQFEVSPNRIPVEAFWDQQDARLLAVETEYAKLTGDNSKPEDKKEDDDDDSEDEEKEDDDDGNDGDDKDSGGEEVK